MLCVSVCVWGFSVLCVCVWGFVLYIYMNINDVFYSDCLEIIFI